MRQRKIESYDRLKEADKEKEFCPRHPFNFVTNRIKAIDSGQIR